MPDWIRDLHEKAGKATSTPGNWWAIGGPMGDAEFIAACSPERVLALCELAKAAQEYLDAEDEWHIRYGMGRERIPYRHAMDDARLRLLAALASLEPARKEET